MAASVTVERDGGACDIRCVKLVASVKEWDGVIVTYSDATIVE